MRRVAVIGMCCGAASCAGAPDPGGGPPPLVVQGDRADHTEIVGGTRQLSPMLASLYGFMPLRSTRMDEFRRQYPTYDGRGVLIAILDSGVDVGVPGLAVTSTGERKVLDLRDFSDEAIIELQQLDPAARTIMVAGRTLTGFDRIARLARPPFYAGVLDERRFGAAAAADVNGNRRVGDLFPVIVGRGTQGWFVVTDTDGDDQLDDERPVHDYLVAAETFGYRSVAFPERGPMTMAVNVTEDERGRPSVRFVFDNSGHGTHVAGIAAGHRLYEVDGFDGVAPGAYLLGLKISDNTRGGITVPGSMLKALNYAADFAARRGLPLIVNVSFGIGNEREGAAAVDSIVDEFALKHPDVLVVISAGNDGPGVSSVWMPGSAEHALTVCAITPGVFAREQQPGVPAAADVLAWWSSRGGEVPKPDLCAPGVAYSTVPPWRSGHEISLGTSMAAPHVSGLAANLRSGLQQSRRGARAIDIKRALMNTARPVRDGSGGLDQGAGLADVMRAFPWLLAGHRSGIYRVRALSSSPSGSSEVAAAFERRARRTSIDSVQRFSIASVGGQPAARLLFESDQPWLTGPAYLDMTGAPAVVTLRYDQSQLGEPGMYVGRMIARPATDTAAGASFELLNTVIVPHRPNPTLVERGGLAPGGLARVFVEASGESGGLLFDIRVPPGSPEVGLQLFEPSGRPARGLRGITVGGPDSRRTVRVDPHDLVPGIYEAVVVAPPAEAAQFELRVSNAPITITAIQTAGVAHLYNPGTDTHEVSVQAQITGITRSLHVATSSRTHRVPVEVPSWADAIDIEVSVPTGVWQAVTDFGLTLFDKAGWKMMDAPLSYAVRRASMGVRDHRGEIVEIELLPAFAHLRGPSMWEADLTVTFTPGDSVRTVAWPVEPPATVVIRPRERRVVSFAVPPFALPDGFSLSVDVSVGPPGGAPMTVRRGPVMPPTPTAVPGGGA